MRKRDIEAEGELKREEESGIERQRESGRERQREGESGIERERETENGRERESGREKQRERKIVSESERCVCERERETTSVPLSTTLPDYSLLRTVTRNQALNIAKLSLIRSKRRHKI